MSKYGKSNEQESRRQSVRLEKEAAENLIWRRDPERPVDEEVMSDFVPNGKITQRVVKYAGTNEVVEFAVTYSIRRDNGKWSEVLCIDTCHHGTVHRHRDGDHESPPEAIVVIYEQPVLHDALWKAIDEAYDAVEWS